MILMHGKLFFVGGNERSLWKEVSSSFYFIILIWFVT